MIDSYVSKGYLEKLSPIEIAIETPLTYYLYLIGVINHNKPDKLMIVFDAASKTHGYCLNDLLLTGPNLYYQLVSVLNYFREHSVVFVGDIRNMFLQIKIREED